MSQVNWRLIMIDIRQIVYCMRCQTLWSLTCIGMSWRAEPIWLPSCFWYIVEQEYFFDKLYHMEVKITEYGGNGVIFSVHQPRRPITGEPATPRTIVHQLGVQHHSIVHLLNSMSFSHWLFRGCVVSFGFYDVCTCDSAIYFRTDCLLYVFFLYRGCWFYASLFRFVCFFVLQIFILSLDE